MAKGKARNFGKKADYVESNKEDKKQKMTFGKTLKSGKKKK